MGKAQLPQPPQLRKSRCALIFYFETLRKLRCGLQNLNLLRFNCAALSIFFFFRLIAQFYTFNLILFNFDRYINKFRRSLANYLLFFCLKSQKNAIFALCCGISVAQVKLRFNLVRKCTSAIALRFN